MREHRLQCLFVGAVMVVLQPPAAAAQAVAQTQGTNYHAVANSPGVFSMQVTEDDSLQVLRSFFEAGSVRALHAHRNATFHVISVITGVIEIEVRGETPRSLAQGEVLRLPAAVAHGFRNRGSVTATVVEVFGKRPDEPVAVEEIGPLQ